MSFIVGVFYRHESSRLNNTDPMYEVQVVEDIEREHFGRCRNEDNYQIINTYTHQYFDPNNNTWVKIQNT
jgi:hypothetical protein